MNGHGIETIFDLNGRERETECVEVEAKKNF